MSTRLNKAIKTDFFCTNGMGLLHNIEKDTFLIIFNVVMNIRVIAERKLLLEVACSDKIKNKRSQ
jgi:hypothetical protein